MPSTVSTTNAQTLTVTIPATTAGNCLIVCIGATSGNATPPTVTGVTLGGAAGNFAALVTKTATNGISASDGAFIWADPNCAGGQTSVVISGTSLGVAAATGGVTVYEVSGLVLSAVLDKSSGGSSGSAVTTWTSGATATTTQAAEFWVGCVVGAGTVAAPGAPWNDSLAGFTHMAAGTQIVSATGAATYNSTQTSGIYSAVVATLFASASTSGTVQPASSRPAPRRRPARALIAFKPVATVNAAPAPPVSGTVQPATAIPAPRRRLARARILFTPVTTVNAAPRIAGTVQPRPTVPVPRRRRERARIWFRPVTTVNTPRQLLISLASRAGTDDYGNSFPQGILATEGVIEGPVLIGSDAFFYSPSPGFGNLTQSVAVADGTDQYGNAWIAGTATYANNGTFWSAVVVAGGVVNWYKASGPGGPWTLEAGIGFSFNGITGGGLSLTAPAGISGSFAIPQPSPAATSAAIISALFAAGIFN